MTMQTQAAAAEAAIDETEASEGGSGAEEVVAIVTEEVTEIEMVPMRVLFGMPVPVTNMFV